MSLPFILFFACALLAVVGAVLLIVAREPIHSALSLILVMMSLAVLYLLLGAEFIAAMQIIVYAGAIMVLFVFVIMLLNAGRRRTHRIAARSRSTSGLPLAFVPAARDWLTGCSTRAIGATVANGAAAPNRGGFHARAFDAAFPAVSFPV